jgi:hypothetical protein
MAELREALLDIRTEAPITMSSVHSTVFLATNPFRPPDWRWHRAGQFIEARARRRREDDDWVVRARRFRADLARAGGDICRHRLTLKHPELLGAYLLWEGEPHQRWEVEARLLAGQSDGDIVNRVGVEAGVVEAYEAVYLDVRARLRSSDSIAASVIGRRLYEALDVDDIETLWKTMAFLGGPLVLDAMIDNHTEIQPAKNPNLADQIKLLVTVMSTPVTADNSMGILRLEAWLRQFERAEKAHSMVALNKPIRIPPIDIHFGPKTVPLVRAGCAPDDPDEAEQAHEIEPKELSDAGRN